MKTYLLVFLMCFSVVVFSADKTGNGGVGIVCRDRDAGIVSVELLDMYEAKEIHGWIQNVDYLNALYPNKETGLANALVFMTKLFLDHISPNHGMIFGGYLYDYVVKFIDEKEPRALQSEIGEGKNLLKFRKIVDQLSLEIPEKIESKVKILPSHQKLPLTNDFSSTILKKGCGYEQIASYSFDGFLLIDGELFDKLSISHQAALYLHEIIWGLHRQAGLTDSDLARRMVGATFAALEERSRNLEDKTRLYSLMRQVGGMSHLTLKFNYDYDKEISFRHVKLNPEERGLIIFDYIVDVDPEIVGCASTTRWFNWLKDEELAKYVQDANLKKPGRFHWLEDQKLVRGNVGRGQEAPEYYGLRFTSLDPYLTCSLREGQTEASFSAKFVVRRGNKILSEQKFNPTKLTKDNPSLTLRDMPVLFY